MTKKKAERDDLVTATAVRDYPKFLPGDADQFVDGKKPRPEDLRELFGSKTPDVAMGLFTSALESMGADAKDQRQFITALCAEEEPRSAVEAMLLIQMGAMHVAMTKLSMRMQCVTAPEEKVALVKAVNGCARTFAEQVNTLKKYRSKASQTVRVERVTVNEGGQAIVGNVETKGEGGK